MAKTKYSLNKIRLISHQLGGSSGLGALATKNEDRSSEPRTHGKLGVVPCMAIIPVLRTETRGRGACQHPVLQKNGSSRASLKGTGRGWQEIPGIASGLYILTLTHAYTSHTQNYEPANTVYNQVETTMCALVYTHIQGFKRAILFMNSSDPIFYLPNTIAFHLKIHYTIKTT